MDTSRPSTSRQRTPPRASSTPSKRSKPLTQAQWEQELANMSGKVFSDDSGSEIDEIQSDTDSDYFPDPEAEETGGEGEGEDASQHASRVGTVFAWSDGANIEQNVPHFDRDTGGITADFDLEDDASELEYFKMFFDQEVMGFICDETQKFFDFANRDEPLSSSKRRAWTTPNIAEMYVFFALLMFMSHIRKHVLQEYWLTHDDIAATPVFGKFMARDRFLALLRYLHFVDNDYPVANDRLWKIRDLFTMLKDRYTKFFRPFQKVVVDESLVLFRGRIVFRQYIPSKRHRFGIKFFVLCDCETGYVLDLIVYTGTDIDIPKHDPHGFSGAVVKKLMDPYLNANHILYTDNYYTSPALAEFLLEHATFLCGTVHPNRKNWPKFEGKLKRGDIQLKQARNMLAIRWHDKRDVNMLTTIHKGDMVDSGKVDYKTTENIMKPDAVVDYTYNMRLVDKSDMQVGAVECVRKCVKWYKKMFLHLIDITVLNSYNLYLSKTGNYMSLRLFSKRVIEQIFATYGTVTSAAPRRHSTSGLPDRLLARDYISRHFPEDIPGRQGRAKGQRACHVCKNTTKRESKRKDVTTWCKECGVALCLPCFKDFHTMKAY